jgi:hypothetical protein
MDAVETIEGIGEGIGIDEGMDEETCVDVIRGFEIRGF